MKKRSICWALALLMVMPLAIPASGHDKKGHDKIIESILFGKENYKDTLAKDSKEYEALDSLEKAVAICLDQYNGSYAAELNDLNDRGIPGIPDNIEKIDFTGNQHHRRYTHRGWNFQYTTDLAHWDMRKTLLLQTVNHVFKFKKKMVLTDRWPFMTSEYKDQCEAFAMFLYYLHILGDYDDAKEKKVIIGNVIPLAREHPGDDNEDIFWELDKVLPIIFQSSSGDVAYKGLEQDIKLLAQEARGLGELSDENFQQYCTITEDLIEKLESKAPEFLKEEPYFIKIFY